MGRLRWPLRGLLLGGAVLALLFWGHDRAVEARGVQDKKEPKKTRKVFGMETCIECHSNGPRGIVGPICKCTEVPTWLKEDKHPEAWKVLLSDRAREMGKRLGWKGEDEEREIVIDLKTEKKAKVQVPPVARDPRCVRCHGVYLDKNNPEDVEAEAPNFRIEEGVSCVACHGAVEEWVDKHRNKFDNKNKFWRSIKPEGKLTSREVKERDYGMTDLWDPVKRTDLCLSCHVGNPAEGKFVTHEMYAAGHPPLPGIEVATFSEEIPRHWDYLSAKTPAVRGLQDFRGNEVVFERTQLVMLSSLASLRNSVSMVLPPDKKTDVKIAEGGAFDYALFDCSGCHHELRAEGWRNRRAPRGRPGRPQPQAWTGAVARATLRAMGRPDREFDDALAPLREVFDRRPFGDKAAAAEVAPRVVKSINDLIDRVKAHPLNRAFAETFLTKLSTLNAEDQPDYDSARQLAWAFRIVYAEARNRPYADVKKDSESPGGPDSLQGLLRLSLPATQQRPLEKELPLVMDRRANHQPDPFKKAFHKLAEDWLQRR